MARQQKNDRVMQQRPAIVRRGRRTVRQINKAIENLEKLKENVEDSEIINKIDEQIKKIEEISKSISENLKFIEDNVSENVEIDDNMSKGEANRIGNLRNEIVRNTRALQSAENSFGNIIQNINSEEQLADLVNGNILDDISEISRKQENISQDQEDVVKQEETRTTDANQPETGDIDGRIATAQERLRATGERMRAARAEGNDQAYAQARSEYSSLTEEISNLQNEKQRQEETKTPKANEQEAEDIDGRIATAQKELRETAEKVRVARRAGNEEEAKEEQKKYNEIASEIKKLVIKKQNEAIKKNRAALAKDTME